MLSAHACCFCYPMFITFPSLSICTDRAGGQFHVDNLSSAHVYLRLRDGQAWDALPTEVVEDCAQLTKANSIEGTPPRGANDAGPTQGRRPVGS